MASSPSDVHAPLAEPGVETGGAVRIGRNFVYRIGAQVLSALVNVGAMILLGRSLSADGYGEYAFWYALVAIVASVSDAGIGIVVTREIARDRTNARRIHGDALIVKAVVSTCVIAAVLAIAPVALDAGRAALLVLIAFSGVIDFGQDPSIWVARAHERLDLEAAMLLVSQVVWFGLVALAITMHLGLVGLLASATAAFVVRAVVGAIVVTRRFGRPIFHPDVPRLLRLVKSGVPCGLAMLAVVLYARVGLLVLHSLATDVDTSNFQVGYLLSQPFAFVAAALSMAMFPSVARHAQTGSPALGRSLQAATKYQFLLAFPLSLALMLLAGPLIGLFFHGKGFAGASTALRVMSVGLAIIFLNNVARHVLNAMDRQNDYLRAILVGIAVQAGVAALLVPRLGFLGACFAFLVAEVAICLMCQRVLVRWVPAGDVFAAAARPLVAAVLAGSVMLVLHPLPLPIVAIAGALVYLLLVQRFGALTENDLRLFRRVFVSFGVPGAAARNGGPS
jgi:O-antigen/teichoic acid export membrane protein